jgi:hypothetical protein
MDGQGATRMPLNPLYMPAPSLQEGFVDKETGELLANGQVFSFVANTNTPKPLYEYDNTQNPPYVPLSNPVILSAVGTFQDANGNDIIPYYYPYDSDGNVQLYTLKVYNANGTLQFTRNDFPNVASGEVPGIEGVELTNFVPNGQFLFHNNNALPPSTTTSATFTYTGLSTNTVWQIAPGGWTFERTSTSSATDTITFDRLPNTIGIPPEATTSVPRYACRITRSMPSNDVIVDLRIKFNDVNKFDSSNGSQPGLQNYTLLFSARTFSGSITSANVFVINYYGTGGSPSNSEEYNFGSPFDINTTYQTYALTGSLTTDSGATLGTNDDDFIQFAFRIPVTGSSTFDIEFTNVALIPGTYTNQTVYPIQTNGDFLLNAMANVAPAVGNTTTYVQDGSNLYLPLVMTLNGLQFDNSAIGEIYASFVAPVNNELLCDGTSYLSAGISSLGIPYSRLFNKWYSASTRGTIFGSGPSWLNCYLSTGVTGLLMLTQNSLGSISANPSDSLTNPTGFTFTSTPGISGRTSVSYNARCNVTPVVNAVSTFMSGTHSNNAAAAGTSTMTISNWCTPAGIQYKFFIDPIAANSLASGSGTGLYFTFSDHTTDYYMWFKSNTESDPMPGGTGIECFLIAGMSATDSGIAIAAGLSSRQLNYITCGASSTFSAGAWFNFYVGSVLNTVWYQKAGSGSPPTTGATNYIMVAVGSGDNATTVAEKTQAAINSVYFAVPDLRGVMLRGNDPNAEWDYNSTLRYNIYEGITEPALGSIEIDGFSLHNHIAISSPSAFTGTVPVTSGSGSQTALNTTISTSSGTPATLNISTSGTVSTTIGFTGIGETRPVNAAVNWVVKY